MIKMPGGDKTGPRGEGAMTGRGMGFCAGFENPGSMNPGVNPRARGGAGLGRGLGWGNRRGFYATGQPGWGQGRGRGNVYFPPESDIDLPQQANRQDEVRYLKNEVKRLNQLLEEINSRMDKLSKMDEK
jgi:hypothetical protein